MSSPFAPLRPAILVAGMYAAAVLVWMVLGDQIAGGRWLVVHLFTVGVLSNLIVAFTDHFARALLHVRGPDWRAGRLLAWNAGAGLLLVGLPTGWTAAVAVGAVVLLLVVSWLYVDLRRMRKGSLAGRFGFVVRGYERACGAFLHGGLLGLLMGVGVLGGSWYGAARLAHLHSNVLGWGGLTLLATVVFFGPTVMRARIEPGADEEASTALGVAAQALTVAVLGLLLTGAEGAVAVSGRWLATAGLAVYGFAAGRVCLPVLRTLRRGRPSAPALHVAAACAWLPAAVALDAVAVAAGSGYLLNLVGALVLVGVLLQALLGAVGYVSRAGAPPLPLSPLMLWAGPAGLNTGLVLIAAASLPAWPAEGITARLGWALVAAAAAITLASSVATGRAAAAGRR